MASSPPPSPRSRRRSSPAPAPTRAASHPLQALARFVVALSVALNTGLCLLMVTLGADTWWVELMRYLPYLLILVPALLALLLSFTLGWGWRTMALGSLALTAVPLMGWVVGTPESGDGPRLRVMSYNIKSYKAEDRPEGYGPLVLEIRRHDPDVLLMQDAQLLTKPDLAIPAPMAQLLESYPHIDRRNQYVIASRHPLRGCRLVPLAEPPARGHFQQCRLTLDKRELELVNVHLLSPREGLNAARHDQLGGLDDWKINYGQRLSQALRLADELGRGRASGPDRQPLPLIVAGDLNAPESSPVVRSLLALGLRDAWSTAGSGYGYTHGHSLRPHLSFLRIDHLLVDGSLAVERVEVGGAEASEHRPLIAELRLDRHGR